MEIEKKKYWLLLYGLILGIIFDILFYNKTLGISYLIFILVIITVIILIFLKTYNSLEKKAWVWVAPAIFLSITFSIYSNQILKILNFMIIPYLMIMLIACVSKLNRADWADLRFLADFAKRVFVPLKYIHIPFITFFRMTEGKEGKKGRIITRIALGLIISIPILALIIWLLSSADIIFKDMFLDIPVSRIIKHFFVILAVSIYAICFLWSILKSYDEEKKPSYSKIKWKKFLDPVVLITIISLLNIVYTVFSVIQFTYLFWGRDFYTSFFIYLCRICKARVFRTCSSISNKFYNHFNSSFFYPKRKQEGSSGKQSLAFTFSGSHFCSAYISILQNGHL